MRACIFACVFFNLKPRLSPLLSAFFLAVQYAWYGSPHDEWLRFALAEFWPPSTPHCHAQTSLCPVSMMYMCSAKIVAGKINVLRAEKLRRRDGSGMCQKKKDRQGKVKKISSTVVVGR